MKLLIILLLTFNSYAQDSWRFEADKQFHLEVSAIIGFTTSLYFASNGYDFTNLKRGIIVGSSVGLGAGLLKECIDRARGGQFSGYDLGYDVLGVATGVGLTYLIVKISHHNKKKKQNLIRI